MSEKWAPVYGYEQFYEVSNLGNVRTLPRKVEYPDKRKSYIRPAMKMKQTTNCNGYNLVSLRKDGVTKMLRVHRLVLLSFVGCDNARPFVNHKDGVKNNNSLLNLEWATRSENTKHAYDNGLISKVRLSGEKHPQSKMSIEEVKKIRSLFKQGIGPSEVSRIVNRPYSTVYSVKSGQNWKDF